jgi:hypothetical protein
MLRNFSALSRLSLLLVEYVIYKAASFTLLLERLKKTFLVTIYAIILSRTYTRVYLELS